MRKKSLRILLISVILLSVLPIRVKAQYASGKPTYFYSDIYNKNRFYAVFRPTFVESNFMFWDCKQTSITASGGGIGYERAMCVNRAVGLFVNYGVNTCFSRSPSIVIYDRNDPYYDWYHETATARLSVLSVSAPINVGWQFVIGKSRDIVVMPYMGISAIAHAYGTAKISTQNNYTTMSQRINIFSTDLFHGDTCNMFNIGWNFGSYLTYKKLLLGIDYTLDLFDLYKEKDDDSSNNIRTSSIELKIGIEM